jgi:hypothetical protein
MVDVFGDSEHVLRFLPFVASIASLFFFLRVAQALLPKIAVILALFLFATLEPFVYYSAEAKQYGFDVAIGLLLLLLAIRALPAPPRFHALWPIAVAGVIAPWFSHASVFFLAGFGAAAIAVALLARDLGSLWRQAVVYALWLVSFGIEYAVSIRHLHQLEVSVTGGESAPTSNVVKGLYVIFSDPGQLPRTVVGVTAFLAAAGALVVWRKRADVLVMIGATAAIAVLAGLQHKYPIGQRFILFVLPLAVLLVAAGSVEIVSSLRRPLSLVTAAVIACLVFIPTAATAAKHLVRPPDSEPAKSLLAYTAAHWQPGDTLYVFHDSQYAVRYYLTCKDCNDADQQRERELWPFKPSRGYVQTAPALVSQSPALVIGGGKGDPLDAYTADLRKLHDRGRVWLLYTHYWPLDLRSILLALRDAHARQLQTVEKGSAVLALYDFR